MPVSIRGIDHVVLTVRDMDATVSFYTGALGMEHVVFGDGLHSVHFGSQKLNLHVAETDVTPKADRPTPGSVDLCLLSDTPISEVCDHLRASGVKVIEGPVERTGGGGKLLSVYFRDPDGNLIEVSNPV